MNNLVSRLNRALFIDRDGIFNELVPWGENGELCAPRNWQEVKFYPGLEKLGDIRSLNYKLIMVTNQPDIERGFITAEFVEELNSHCQKTYNLDAIYCCPFSSDDHPNKKPNPGMFLDASTDFGLDLSQSYFLGDTERDVGAANNVGIPSIIWDREYNRDLKPDYRIHQLNELDRILNHPRN